MVEVPGCRPLDDVTQGLNIRHPRVSLKFDMVLFVDDPLGYLFANILACSNIFLGSGHTLVGVGVRVFIS